MKEIILKFLLENTDTENIYTGGGIEPSVVTIKNSEDWSREGCCESLATEIEKNLLSEKMLILLNRVLNEAEKKLYEFLGEGEGVDIATEEELEEDIYKIDSLPMVSHVDKHSFYEEFGVTSVYKKDDKIILSLRGKSEENEGTTIDISMDEMSERNYQISDTDFCQLVDLSLQKVKK